MAATLQELIPPQREVIYNPFGQCENIPVPIRDGMQRKVPVFLEPGKDRRIVVFGGGNVALRKCAQFAGFHITVIAEKTVPGIENVCDEIVLERFSPDDIGHYLKNCFIVIAATDSKDLNKAITQSARKLGILVNSAHGGGDVLLPSVVRKEHYSVAVSSEGSVPAFPPYVASLIDNYLGPEFDRMMDLLIEVRKDLDQHVSQQPKRAELLSEILHDQNIWDMLKKDDYDNALKAALDLRDSYSDL